MYVCKCACVGLYVTAATLQKLAVKRKSVYVSCGGEKGVCCGGLHVCMKWKGSEMKVCDCVRGVHVCVKQEGVCIQSI